MDWATLTDPVLLDIYSYLSPREIIYAGATCKQWNRVSFDNILWRNKFRAEHNIKQELKLDTCWYEEYKRLVYHAPSIETEVLKSHSASVLHVSFSHNGKYFVTCSMDAQVMVWHSSYPADVKCTQDMRRFGWKFSHYSEFNDSDSLLLVSGSHGGPQDDSSGEIGVFSVEDEMTLICRILNKPFDVFGSFYSEACIFSGQVHQLENLLYSSSIWLHKACPDVTCEYKPLMSRIFRFLNVSANCVRSLVVARCNESKAAEFSRDGSFVGPSTSDKQDLSPINSHHQCESEMSCKMRMDQQTYNDRPPSFSFQNNLAGILTSNTLDAGSSSSASPSPEESEYDDEDEDSYIDSDEDLTSQPEKYLIFTTGSKANVPHQIGVKRIGQIKFPKKLDPGPSLAERIAERREQANRPPVSFENIDLGELSRNFDPIDHLFEMHGHITGMKLSPDHRYLYVNCRPWPEGYVIANPLDPPPVAQEIDIHVINMETLKEVGGMLRAHRGYTASNECCLIFLDVSKNYIASGSEDKHGYLWDRRYGIGLTKFPHDDVVNCVAFNPRDQEMLVTVSQDSWIKIWRSKARAKDLNINTNEYPKAVRIPVRLKRSTNRQKM